MDSTNFNECFQINQTEVNVSMNDADSFTEPPTKRGKARVYEYIKKFNTVEDAKK